MTRKEYLKILFLNGRIVRANEVFIMITLNNALKRIQVLFIIIKDVTPEYSILL